MRVIIPVEFEVESEEEGLNDNYATGAASLAVENYLSFCEISGYSTDTNEVSVYVDGFGECTVKLITNYN